MLALTIVGITLALLWTFLQERQSPPNSLDKHNKL